MKVILLTDVAKLGRKYDIKEVSSGYALNLLIPQGQAKPATPEALKSVEAAKVRLEGERKVQEDLLVKNIKDLEKVSLKVSGKANDKGHLFAGLHREAIAEELRKQTGLAVNPSFIELEHPIKEVGEHTVKVSGGGKSAQFKVIVEASKE